MDIVQRRSGRICWLKHLMQRREGRKGDGFIFASFAFLGDMSWR